jgi:MFS family permease
MTLDWLLVTISLFIWGIGEGAYLPFQAVYLQNVWHASPIIIGVIFGLNGVMMTATQIPAGLLTDRFGPRPFMWLTWVMGMLSTWVMALASNLSMFVTGILLYGLTSAVLPPMNSYLAARRGKLSIERALTLPGAAFQGGW